MDKAKLIEYLKNRIKELNQADANFCKDRWDMSKPEQERKLYRDMSNEVTASRKELERVLNYLTSLTAPVPDGKVTDEEIIAEARLYAGSNYSKNHFPDHYENRLTGFIEGAKWMHDKLTKTPDLPDGKAIIKGRSPYEAYKLFIEQAENEIRELGLDLTEDIIMVYALKHCEEYIRHFEKAKQLIYSGGQINKK